MNLRKNDEKDSKKKYANDVYNLTQIEADIETLNNAAPVTVPVKCTGAEIDTGTDDAKFATSKALEDSSYAKTAAIPVKATGAEIDTGTDDAKFATAKALADSTILISRAWPVGSVFLSVVATNPATLLGIGTWTQIANGQFLVGQKAADADFDTAEETGGAKTHLHTVDPPVTTTSQPSIKNYNEGTGAAVVPGENHTHTVDISVFNSGTASNVPPYFVIYIWKRVA